MGVGNVLWAVVGVFGGTSSGVVCDVGVVLVLCWYSGVVVGGAVVVWWGGGGGGDLSNLKKPIFPLEGGIAAQILILLWWYFIC